MIWILYALISTAIWLPQIDKLFVQDVSLISQYVSLIDSWSITVHGETYHNVSLDDFSFAVVNKVMRSPCREYCRKIWIS